MLRIQSRCIRHGGCAPRRFDPVSRTPRGGDQIASWYEPERSKCEVRRFDPVSLGDRLSAANRTPGVAIRLPVGTNPSAASAKYAGLTPSPSWYERKCEVRRFDPVSVPDSVARSPAPRCHTTRPELREKHLAAYREFVDGLRAALTRLVEALPDLDFPSEGSRPWHPRRAEPIDGAPAALPSG